ncbi:hypothetical protein Dimus_035867 [Dionaea muscipula]
MGLAKNFCITEDTLYQQRQRAPTTMVINCKWGCISMHEMERYERASGALGAQRWQREARNDSEFMGDSVKAAVYGAVPCGYIYEGGPSQWR